MHNEDWKRAFLAGLTMTTLALAACGGGGGASPDQIAAGQAEFRKTCATCHGPNAQGMERLGKNLHENAFVQSKSNAELVEFIKRGRPATHPDNLRGVDMPPRGGNPALKDEQIELIVAYVRSLQ
jgi:disulfide bond formation protein DsbB